MSAETSARLLRELDLMERVADYHGKRFLTLIDQLNAHPNLGATDLHSIRLCVEAVSAMLESQDRLARTLLEVAGGLAEPVVTLRKAA